MRHPMDIKKKMVALLRDGYTPKELEETYGICKRTIYGFESQIEKVEKKEQKLQSLQATLPKGGVFCEAAKGSVVLAIPDLHCPFQHVDALDFLKAVADKIQPDKIVALGDEIDAHAYSRWPKSPDGMTAGQELKAAIEALTPFYAAFPKVQVCISNHTIRPKKLMFDAGLPAAFWPKYETMLNAPDGWSWHEHIIIDNVRYMHGDQGKGGMNGWTKNSEVYHQSTVVGHWHSKAGVYYDSSMFNVNAGCLIDEKAYAFEYAKNSHKRPNLGCAVITHGRKAAFLPMILDGDGRWIKNL